LFILDAGCGYGYLLPYLSTIYSEIQYTGIEQISTLLDEAIRRHSHLPNASFISGNFTKMALPTADYVFASGSLNYHGTDADFIFKAIAKLFAACRIGFAFNPLSEIIPNDLIVAYDPGQIIPYCSSISPKVKLIRGYAPDDFTVLMYR
jgi:SAM-dependent methyltransferase